MKAWRLICRIWFILFERNRELMVFQHIYGHFHVRYNDDGRVSQNMTYWTANDYAKMFDGKVEDSF